MNSKAGNQRFIIKHSLLAFTKSLFELSIYANFFVAAVTTTAAFYYLYRIDNVSVSYLSFLFFSTLFVYIIDRHTIKKQDLINKSKRSTWLQKNKKITNCTALLSFLIYSTLFLHKVNSVRAISVLCLLCLCLCYCRGTLFRFPAGKNLILAGIWSTACIFMPTLWIGEMPQIESLYPFFIYFICSFINSALCDYEDKTGDKHLKIKSLPLCLSENTFKSLINFLCVALAGIAYYSEFQGFVLTAISLMLINCMTIKASKSFLSDLTLCLPIIYLLY